jgi:hypothetical protein
LQHYNPYHRQGDQYCDNGKNSFHKM